MSDQKKIKEDINLPDFDQLAFRNLVECLRVMTACSKSPRRWSRQNQFWADELRRVFEQGRVLGQREGRFQAEEEWWFDFDKDMKEQEASLKSWSEETEEEALKDWDVATCKDYLSYEEESCKIINSEKNIPEKLIDSVNLGRITKNSKDKNG